VALQVPHGPRGYPGGGGAHQIQAVVHWPGHNPGAAKQGNHGRNSGLKESSSYLMVVAFN